MDHKTRRIYAVTKEGRAINEKGIDMVRNMLEAKDDDEILMGAKLNDAKWLSKEIEKRTLENSQTAIIFSERINKKPRLYAITGRKNMKKTAEALKKTKKTSWETIKEMIEKTGDITKGTD